MLNTKMAQVVQSFLMKDKDPLSHIVNTKAAVDLAL